MPPPWAIGLHKSSTGGEIRPVLRILFLLLPGVLACSPAPADRADESHSRDTVVVFDAASLSGPMRAVLDTFARREGAIVLEEHGASLELARRVTELSHVPDVIALADQEVFPELLVPRAASWYVRFARNRMVVAYTSRSRLAEFITPANWYEVVLSPDVLLGRTDPAQAPAGYRTLLMYELAETHYRQPELRRRLTANTPTGLIRGNAADLAALLEAGEVDYIVDYESVARAHHFRWVALPSEIDLGDPARATEYGRARLRILRGHDTVTVVAAPILYGLSVPRAAPHREAGARFAAFVLGVEGRRILRAGQVNALDAPEIVGDSVPAVVRAASHP